MKKVVIVFDVCGWAWHRRAQDIQAFAPPEYEVDIHNETAFFARYDGPAISEPDAIFFMSWASSPTKLLIRAQRIVTLVTSSGPLYDHIDDADWRTRIITGSRNKPRAMTRLPPLNGVICVNRELASSVEPYARPTYLIPSGVNCDVYHSGKPPDNEKFTVGWCGNPTPTRKGYSVKGYDEVLVPLMKLRPNWNWSLNTRNHHRALGREEMAAWYRTLDAFVCTSICEGTPSPVFEAAASGVPIVSTDVGCVADWNFPGLPDWCPDIPHGAGLIVPSYHDATGAERTIEHISAILDELESKTVDDRVMIGSVLRRSLIADYHYDTISPRYLRAITGEDEKDVY